MSLQPPAQKRSIVSHVTEGGPPVSWQSVSYLSLLSECKLRALQIHTCFEAKDSFQKHESDPGSRMWSESEIKTVIGGTVDQPSLGWRQFTSVGVPPGQRSNGGAAPAWKPDPALLLTSYPSLPSSDWKRERSAWERGGTNS